MFLHEISKYLTLGLMFLLSLYVYIYILAKVLPLLDFIMSLPSQRAWVFTLNNFTPDDIEKLKHLTDVKYMVFQEELSRNQTPHLQGYIEFKRTHRMKWIKERTSERIHLEKRRGTRDEARDYCMKPGGKNLVEIGDFDIGHGHRTDIDKVKECFALLDAGKRPCDLLESHPWTVCRYINQINTYMFLQSQKQDAFRRVLVTLITGETGVGKTRYVYERESPNDLFILCNDSAGTTWWDGYTNQDAILLDDFYGWIKWGYLLRILDGYPLRVPIKGSHVFVNFTRVYITSNTWPSSWYNKVTDGQYHALARRINLGLKFLEDGSRQVHYANNIFEAEMDPTFSPVQPSEAETMFPFIYDPFSFNSPILGPVHPVDDGENKAESDISSSPTLGAVHSEEKDSEEESKEESPTLGQVHSPPDSPLLAPTQSLTQPSTEEPERKEKEKQKDFDKDILFGRSYRPGERQPTLAPRQVQTLREFMRELATSSEEDDDDYIEDLDENQAHQTIVLKRKRVRADSPEQRPRTLASHAAQETPSFPPATHRDDPPRSSSCIRVTPRKKKQSKNSNTQ